MSDYDARAQATAARLLATTGQGGKGQAVILKSPSAATRDPLTGTSSVTYVSQAVSGIEIDFNLGEIDGTQILDGDRKFMLSAVDLTGANLNPAPQPSMLLTLQGRDWVIVTIKRLAPTGLAIYYELHIRGVK